VGFNNHTLRVNPRVSIGGDTLRVRVSNAYGHGKLAIGAASVGIQDKGPATVPGSERQLTLWRLRFGDGRDGLHPSDLGYCTMGDAIDLALFE
jgi:lysophospholipase L1-like esterase